MKTFNLTSYHTGGIIKTVKAKSFLDAKNELESKGYDCQDDYYLETIEERAKIDALPSRTIYIDEIR
jgi:hypothetical protein